MSDTPQGPGWWQGSDGRFYSPSDVHGPRGVTPVEPPGPYPPPVGSRPTAGKATAALILAIASFVVCPVVPAIVALVLAAQAKREIESSQGRLDGEGLVTAARVISIIHLAMSVLVIPLMLAIAVPTFLAAQDRAQDRRAQMELRMAKVAAEGYYSGTQQWTDDPAALQAIDPSLRFMQGDTPVAEGYVYVLVEGPLLGLAAKSKGGDCFYLMADAGPRSTLFAEDENCGPIREQDFQLEWEE